MTTLDININFLNQTFDTAEASNIDFDQYDEQSHRRVLARAIALIEAYGSEIKDVLSEEMQKYVLDSFNANAGLTLDRFEKSGLTKEDQDKQIIELATYELVDTLSELNGYVSYCIELYGQDNQVQEEQDVEQSSNQVVFFQEEPHSNNVILTDSNIGIMQDLLRWEISRVQEEIAFNKTIVSHWYAQSDKNNPATGNAFENLNYFRNILRKHQKRLRKLEQAQRNLRVNRIPD